MKSVSISASDFDNLRRNLFTSDGKENAALLTCGVARTSNNERLLVREMLSVPPEAYTERLAYHLEIAPRFINSVIDRCMAKGLGIVTAHSHPTSGPAEYSLSDNAGEGRLFKVFSDLLGADKHGSLLFTLTDAAGRLPRGNGFVSLDLLSVVGSHISLIALVKRQQVIRENALAAHDRQVLAFGRDGQVRLGELRVGIVGLGGTGSAVAEQLVRLGVRQFVLIDPDTFEPSNLSRLYGSSFADTKKRAVFKTRIVSRLLKSVSPTVELATVEDSVVRQSVLLTLRDCDVVFACTDNDWSRAVLNRFAYQYLIPLIDLGIRITVNEGSVQGIGGRVARIGPDTACLRCARHLDPDRIRAESMPASQRRALAREHYIEGVDNPAPAVISLNTTVAGLAVSEMLFLVLHVGEDTRPNELLYDGLQGVTFRVRPDRNPNCDICGPDGLKGIGDLQVVSAYE